MRAAVRKIKEREYSGKASALRIRGSTIQYAELVRYFSRKHMTIEDVLALRRSSLTPEVVECLTPVPSPVTTPIALAVPEQIFRTLRDYYSGSFQAGTWVLTEAPYDSYSAKRDEQVTNALRDLYDQSMAACDLFKYNLSKEAGQTLISATAAIKQLVKAEPPQLLRELLSLSLHICRTGRYEILFSILRTCTRFSAVFLGPKHPLRHILTILASLEISLLRDVAIRALELSTNHFEATLGLMHNLALYSRLRYLQSHTLIEDDCAGPVYQTLLQTCDAVLGEGDTRTLDVRFRFAYYLNNKKRYYEAVLLCNDIYKHAFFIDQAFSPVYFRSEALFLSAVCLCEFEGRQQAEASLRAAIDLRMSECGLDDGRVRQWLVLLEGWLMDWGRQEDASEVRAERQYILNVIEEIEIESGSTPISEPA